MNIGDIFYALRGDGSPLMVDAQRAAEAAAGVAGTTFRQKFGSALTAATGAAIGAGFAIAARGAAQLDAATQQLVADTGLVGPAAAQAKDQIASLYRDNLQGFDAISAALSKVHTDLGLTGDTAGTVTGDFLKFSTATGQDAAEAVANVDDALDAFNLKATEAPALLDKLIISHQRWGGSIAENELALAKLAPALVAANLNIDDGIGLLNLFQAAGIDASKAPQALAHALNLVKSPQELKKLLDDITNTKDPFERAQKAIDLFGSRAGPQLAQALAQGHLEDFTVNMTDATGATDKAAAAVESGFGAQFQLILKNAGGALAEFGTNFGPILLVAGQFGPKMVTAIGSGLGGLAGLLLPKIATQLGLTLPAWIGGGAAGGAAMGAASGAAAVAAEVGVGVPAKVAAAELGEAVTAGGTVGTAMGSSAAAAEVAVEGTEVAAGQAVVAAEAIPAAEVAGGTLGLALGRAAAAAALTIPIFLSVQAAGQVGNFVSQPLVDDTQTQIKTKVDQALKGGLGAIQAARDELQRMLDSKTNLWRPEMVTAVTDGLAKLDAALAAGAGDIADTKPVITAAAATAFSGVPAAVAAQLGPTRAAILKLLADAASSVSSGRSKIDSEITALNELAKKPDITRTTELERLLKARTSPTLLKLLTSPDIEKRTAARQVAADLDETIALIRPRPGIMSPTSKQLLEDLKTSTSTELQGFGAWLQLQINQSAAKTVPFGPDVHPDQVPHDPFALQKWKAAQAAAVAAANAGIGSTTTDSALTQLLKNALTSADPLIKNDAKNAGQAFSGSLSDGIKATTSQGAAVGAIKDVVGSVLDWLGLPSTHQSIVDAWHAATSGLTFTLPTSTAPYVVPHQVPPDEGFKNNDSGGPYTAGVPFWVGLNRQPELVVPNTSGTVLTMGQLGAMGGGRPINIENVTLTDAHDEFSLTQQLQFLAAAG